MFKIHLAPSSANATITYNDLPLEGITGVRVSHEVGNVPRAWLDVVLAQGQLDTEIADDNIRFNVRWPDGTLVCILKPEISEYVDGPIQWFIGDEKQ
jgi:hypothetical protein